MDTMSFFRRNAPIVSTLANAINNKESSIPIMSMHNVPISHVSLFKYLDLNIYTEDIQTGITRLIETSSPDDEYLKNIWLTKFKEFYNECK